MNLSNMNKYLPYSLCFFFLLGFGTLYSISSLHWLPIWIGMEINLIAFIPLMTNQGSTLETESAIKYFIFQALGSALFMLGALLSYGSQFSWNMTTFFINTPTQMLILAGLLIKMGGFPAHFWLPSVASGLTWPANIILFIWQKISPIFIMFTLLAHTSCYPMVTFSFIMSIMSAMIGALGGLNQTQIRALLAYSSITHLGWMIFSCSLTKMSMKVYFFSYIIISLSIMSLAWWTEMKQMANSSMNLFKISMTLQPMMMLFFLSLGGLPPLLGFIPKWMIMYTSISSMNMPILIILVISSIISLFYYLSLTLTSFFSPTSTITQFFMTTKSSLHSLFLRLMTLFFMMNLLGATVILNMPLLGLLYAMGFFHEP